MDKAYLLAADRKLAQMYKDFSHNVTLIFQRPELHLAYDLVAHSPLGFVFKGEKVDRGWVEGMIVGDTRTGKTRIAKEMGRHYGSIRLVNCERVSFAGLVGGMQQIGKGWSIQWGVIPLADRRMVTADETTGLTVHQISEMSGMRSSGVAEIIKIHQERTRARCRILWISNPRSDFNRRISSYGHGVQTVPEIMGKAEDISRLDFALVASGDDIGEDVLNAHTRPTVPHTFTSEVCRNRLLWAWSRRPDQVHFVGNTENFILDKATELSRFYSSDIPIVEPSEQRIRLARLSTSMAAILFSTDKDGKQILVREEHVELVVHFLKRCYNSSSMRYDKFSQMKNALTKFTKRQLQECIDVVKRTSKSAGGENGLGALVAYLISTEDIEQMSFFDSTGWTRDDVRAFIRLFTTKVKGFKPGPNRRLQKTPLLIAALKILDEEV